MSLKPKEPKTKKKNIKKMSPKKWEWHKGMEYFGRQSPVVILTQKNIGDWAGSYLGGFSPVPTELKNGYKIKGRCWLRRNPAMFVRVKVNESVIVNGLGLKVYDVVRTGGNKYFLVDENAARKSIEGLAK
jgi:hypothetical protein